MGAWIEIYYAMYLEGKKNVAPYVGAWIEIYGMLFPRNGLPEMALD